MSVDVESGILQWDFTRHVPREMYDLVLDEVEYMRGELSKTRELLAEIIKSQSTKTEIFEKTQERIIDSMKYDNNIMAHNSPTHSMHETAQHHLYDRENSCTGASTITDNAIELPENPLPSGDWAHSFLSDDEPTIQSAQYTNVQENICSPQSLGSTQECPVEQLIRLRAENHNNYLRQKAAPTETDAIPNLDKTDLLIGECVNMETGKESNEETGDCNEKTFRNVTVRKSSSSKNIPTNRTIIGSPHITSSAESNTREWRKGTILIAGDSIINSLDGTRMSARRKVLVKADGGCNIEELKHYLNSWIPKKPTTIILHIGTNEAH